MYQNRINIIVDQTLKKDDHQKYRFKSLQTAFKTIPIGGAGNITIIGNYKLDKEKIETGENKDIVINLKTGSRIETEWLTYQHPSDPNYYFNGWIKMKQILISSGTSLNIWVFDKEKSEETEKIYIPEYPKDYKGIFPYARGLFSYKSSQGKPISFSIGGRLWPVNKNWIVQKSGYLFFRSNWDADKLQAGNSFTLSFPHYTGQYQLDPKYAKIADFSNQAFNVNLIATNRITDLNGIRLEKIYGNLTPLFSGIIFNNNGNVLNINTSYKFKL